MDTWDGSKNLVEMAQVLDLLSEWLTEAEGLTVSGGEPFDQPEQLKYILQEARKHKSIDTLVYTGKSFEEVTGQLQDLDGLIDAIMTDPLNDTLPQTLPLRGSDNQRLFAFTNKGERIKHSIENTPQSDLKVMDLSYSEKTAYLSGIPNRADIVELVERLKAQGTYATAFEDIRVSRSKL